MRLYFFLFVIGSFCISNQAVAQKFNLGLLAGPQAYTVYYEDSDDRQLFDPKIKFGYRVGAYIIFPLEDYFAWSVETFYSRKGRRVETIESGFVNDATYHFWEINFLLRKEFDLNIIEGVKGKWFINLGPNINYWISGRGVIEATAKDLEYDVVFDEGRTKGDSDNNYITNGNRWLFGIDLGLGIDTPILNSQYFETELRFTFGQTFLGARDGSIPPPGDFQTTDNLRSNYKCVALVLRYGLGIDMHDAKKGKSTIKQKRRRRR